MKALRTLTMTFIGITLAGACFAKLGPVNPPVPTFGLSLNINPTAVDPNGAVPAGVDNSKTTISCQNYRGNSDGTPAYTTATADKAADYYLPNANINTEIDCHGSEVWNNQQMCFTCDFMLDGTTNILNKAGDGAISLAWIEGAAANIAPPYLYLSLPTTGKTFEPIHCDFAACPKSSKTLRG